MGNILAAVCAFAASSLWYSSPLFGRQFLEFSGVTASAQPDGLKIAAEMLRNMLLTFVIGELLACQASTRLRAKELNGCADRTRIQRLRVRQTC